MPYFSSPVDSANLFYRYYTPGEDEGLSFRPLRKKTSDVTLVFVHGWPMSSRMFEHLLVPLCETHRFRVLAPDRRGFGKSDWNSGQTAEPITYDTFAADLVGLLTHLDIKNFVFVGASMGGAESVVTYLSSSFVQERCKVKADARGSPTSADLVLPGVRLDRTDHALSALGESRYWIARKGSRLVDMSLTYHSHLSTPWGPRASSGSRSSTASEQTGRSSCTSPSPASSRCKQATR